MSSLWPWPWPFGFLNTANAWIKSKVNVELGCYHVLHTLGFCWYRLLHGLFSCFQTAMIQLYCNWTEERHTLLPVITLLALYLANMSGSSNTNKVFFVFCRVWFCSYLLCLFILILLTDFLAFYILYEHSWDWAIFLGGAESAFFTVAIFVVFGMTVRLAPVLNGIIHVFLFLQLWGIWLLAKMISKTKLWKRVGSTNWS